ncbi:MAG: histidine kinase N-terminal 7TM domain-containing protein [Thermodesulfobacteriota bacterium]|nr:histidine kinase N-terminal 7TM domain-containing protein [Thermodesulfobacteriota bacterium]
MSLQYTPYLIPLITAAAVSAVIAAFTWKRRHAPGKTPFALLMFAVAEWSLSYAFELGSVHQQTKLLWATLKYHGVVVVPVAWFIFTLKYTGHGHWLTLRKSILLLLFPFITLTSVWTNDLHGLFWSNLRLDTSRPFSVLVESFGPWFWIHALYSYILLLLGTILLVRVFLRSPHLFRGQTGGLLIGVLTPWTGNALYLSGLNPFYNVDPTPFGFTLTGLMFSLSLFHFRFLDIAPMARDVVIENMNDVVIVMDHQNRIVDANPAAQQIISHSVSEVIGQTSERALSIWPNLAQRCCHVEEGDSEITLGEGETKRYFDLKISPLYDKGHRLRGRLVALHDITERKQAEEFLKNAHDKLEIQVHLRTLDLLETNEKLKQEIVERERVEHALKESLMLIGRAKREWESTVDSLPQLICLIDNRGCILRTNRVVERWNLGQVVTVKGKKIHDLFHPNCSDPDCYLENFWTRAWEELTHGQSAECEAEDRTMQRYLHVHIRPTSTQTCRKGEAVASYAVTIVNDMTERKWAEKEISDLEEQLRQSQKMEAIGRLAGGIAHDFNNLLTPIVGYSQLTIGMLAPGDPMREDLQEIQKSADRAAKLIRQLMIFSRRQTLKPQVINLNDILLDLGKMVRPLINESIELIILPAQDLGSVMGDPGQFEQVLINLVVNARDAMPSGGKLVLETSNAILNNDDICKHTGMAPGNYVMLAVSDTGIGMNEEVKAHIFEPFFTTKEVGKGTGLGLSTVYGIIKQSNGYILVYSEPGQGTTFKIYLPRLEEEALPLPLRDEIGYMPRGDETVLLVEDEPLVRGFTARVLREQGYVVLEAGNGHEALQTAKRYRGGEFIFF